MNTLLKIFKNLDSKLILFSFLVIIFGSCKTVNFNQKAYIYDREMILSMRQLEKMELNFQLYREGSAGANGGKSGGGCGCN